MELLQRVGPRHRYTFTMTSVMLLLLTLLMLARSGALWRRGFGRRALLWLVGTCLCGTAWFQVTGAYEVRKLVAQCVMPVGLTWIALLVLAVMAARRRRPRAVIGTVWLIWVFVTLVGNETVANLCMSLLERPYCEAFDLAKAGPFDAVLVLGGGVGRAENRQVVLGPSGDRVVLGARLYHLKRTDVLVTSGPMPLRPVVPGDSVPRMTRRVWLDLRVEPESIVMMEGPRTTLEEIRDFSKLVKERGWHRVGVLSSAYHLRRAARHCRRFALQATLIPADIHGAPPPLRARDLVPSSTGLATSRRVWWEVLGAAAGR